MMLKKLPAAVAFATLAVASQSALAQVKIGVVSSATGPTALVGIPQKNTVPLLPTKIGDLTVEYIALDDASDPTASVTAVKKLISEQNVDAIIGPSGSPNAMGVIQFVAEAGVPLLARSVPPPSSRRWTTRRKGLQDHPERRHHRQRARRAHGQERREDRRLHRHRRPVRRELAQGVLGARGEERSQGHGERALPAFRHLGHRAESQAAFRTSRRGAGGRAGRTVGAAADDPARSGLQGRVYQTHGAALPDFLKLGGKKIEGTVLAASLMLVLPEIADSNPSKKVASDYIGAYEKLHGSKPATFGANVYDAGLLLQQAIPLAAKTAKPGTKEFRAALRDSLEQTRELVGTQGVYNMSSGDHSGFDERGRVMIAVKDGGWTLAK